VIQRWEDRSEGTTYPFAVLDSTALQLQEGQIVRIVKGQVQQ